MFLKLHDTVINLRPFSLKIDQLENLTPVEKFNDLLCWFDLYLEIETLSEFHTIEFFRLMTQGRI